ncbi:MAG: hypothetical protein ACXWXV_13695, partial [Aeromicrobium sp.]
MADEAASEKLSESVRAATAQHPRPPTVQHLYTTENGAEIADHDKFLILTKVFAGPARFEDSAPGLAPDHRPPLGPWAGRGPARPMREGRAGASSEVVFPTGGCLSDLVVALGVVQVQVSRSGRAVIGDFGPLAGQAAGS